MKSGSAVDIPVNGGVIGGYQPGSLAPALRPSGAMPGRSGRAPDAQAPLDPGVFGALVGLEAEAPGFLTELLEEFRDGCARRLAVMHAALRTGDAEALSFAAHGMRGSCGTLGAVRMAALARHLEDLPPTRAEERPILVARLETEYAAVRRALDEASPRPFPVS
jgi:HPt (histidine-containing phosphotransfer) domain-containing protein